MRAAGGQAVASWSGQGTSAAVTWNGTSGGARVPDGVYTAELTATPSGGEPASASVQITVDTVAPRLSGASSTGTFSPNGDGQDESAAVAYSPAETCSVRVGILDAQGDVVRWLHGWRPRETRSYSVTWDGRITSGGGLVAAPDGQYRFDVERRDAAGNIARQGVKISVDRTVGFPAAVPVTLSPDGNGVRDTTALTFKLTRKATVTVRVLLDAGVVRTLSLGTLAAGAHSAAWDGRAGLGRVPRQLPAHVHGDRRLHARREPREQGAGGRPVPAAAVRGRRQDDLASGPPPSSASRSRTRSAPRPT